MAPQDVIVHVGTRATMMGPVTSTQETEPEARKTFQEQLSDLRVDVIRVGAMVTEAISGGTQALLDGDLRGAERILEDDVLIDQVAYAIEDQCYVVLARQ